LLLAMGLVGALLISLFSWRSHEDKVRIQALLAKTQSILDAQSAIMVISDGVTLLDHNHQLLDFFGVPSSEVLRSRYACICEAFIRDDKFFHMGKVPEGVAWLAHLQSLPKREHIVSMHDSMGRPHAFALALSHFDGLYIISFTDISDTMREHFDLAERVVRDKLTGAYNREFFANRIAGLIEEAHNGRVMLGFILFDIDHFKNVNDSYGHARGDLVLIQITQLVERTLRYEDTLIRWGGEEFLILAKVPSIEQLVRIAENLRAQIEIDSHPEVGQVTCSFGVTLYQDGESPDESLKRADRALYHAKELGRNRVEMAL
jgi:diguanylate cyclase (GGDEF)-like protein